MWNNTPVIMKTKGILFLLASMAAGVSFLGLRAQSSGNPGSPPTTTLSYPYGMGECIVTLDPQAYRHTSAPAPGEPSGFQSDGTLRGELIYLSDEWCVLKDGTFENWIPRTKLLMIRVSK